MPFAERFGRHTTDSGLLAIVAGAPVPAHVPACALCQARLAELRAWTAGVAAEAGALADETFTADRLANQKKEILRRLESAGRSARVIAFPVGAAAPVRDGRQQVLRWAAAAAIGGILVGIGSARLLDLRPAGSRAVTMTGAATTSPLSPAASPVLARTDDLDEAALLEAAYDRVSIDALQTIDDMTPRAREVARASLPRSHR